MNRTDYIPFDHTYIVYDPEDPFTLVLALSSIFPILVLVFLFSWFCVTRELESCIMAAGQVINDVLSTTFKALVKIERPSGGQIFKKDSRLVYGMPSSHAQFVAFFGIYLLLKMRYQWPYQIHNFVKIISVLALGVFAFLIIYSRLFFEYHNLAQVIVGGLLGTFLGAGYFVAVSLLREYGVTDAILQWRPFAQLYVKDTFNSDKYRLLSEERKEWEDDYLARAKASN